MANTAEHRFHSGPTIPLTSFITLLQYWLLAAPVPYEQQRLPVAGPLAAYRGCAVCCQEPEACLNLGRTERAGGRHRGFSCRGV
jgi:hypothetical protein